MTKIRSKKQYKIKKNDKIYINYKQWIEKTISYQESSDLDQT